MSKTTSRKNKKTKKEDELLVQMPQEFPGAEEFEFEFDGSDDVVLFEFEGDLEE